MVPAPPPLPTRFPCWVRAVYSWGGEVRTLCRLLCTAAPYANYALSIRSPNEISDSSKATLSNASTQVTARGGLGGCGVTGEQSACFRQTSSKFCQIISGRLRGQPARSPTATLPVPREHPRSRGPSASHSRHMQKHHTTQQPRPPRHGRTV